ncbi:MAG: cytochrome c peroxidase [Candidatus Krumholzibacteriota bacterium]
MNNAIRPLLVLAALSLLVLAGCGGGEPADTAAGGPPTPQHKNMFGGMPKVMESADNPLTDAKIELGRILYYEPRMSVSNDISCNSCHVLDEFGVDGLATSPGHDGTLGARNSPTVYNAANHIAQFWDGREPTVEAQAKGPILNPVEHGMASAEAVEEVLRGIPEYAPLFEAAFPGEEEPVTFDNVAMAIGAFERKLTTRGDWDRWLAGDGNAITVQERRGLDTFTEIGCTTCHMGPNLGGSLYQKMGLVEAYPSEDKGRSEVTGNAAEEYFFKVPSLRNIAETGPYMHDGSLESLEEVVRIMAKHQLGKPVTEAQVADMVAFMKKLTGKLPAEYITEPKLPGMS